MTHCHPHASPALHGSTTIVTLRHRILLCSSKSFLYQCLLHRSESNNLLISSWDSSIRLVDVESSKLRLEVQTEAAVLDCCFHNEFVAFSAAFDGSIFRSILRTFAHDDISVESWFIGLDVKHIDDAKLCCSYWSLAGWPGLALAHGCCWFPAATGFGFSVELGMLQGVSAIGAFYELLSQSSLNVSRHGERKLVAPVELCPILKTLYKILIKREQSSEDILQTLRDET